jgi:hypothetical protein
LRQCTSDRAGDGGVLRVDEACDFEGGLAIEIVCSIVRLLGAKAA